MLPPAPARASRSIELGFCLLLGAAGAVLASSVRPLLVGVAIAALAVVALQITRPKGSPAGTPDPLASDRQVQADAAHMRAISDTATEGIISIDSKGVIDRFNGAAERMFGWRAAEVIGQNVRMLMPPPDRDHHDGYVQRYLTTGVKKIIGIGREVVGLRRDESTFPIDLSVGEGIDCDQRFFIAIARDISARKEMQEKLRQAERLASVGELAAGIAHEINNPVNTVINCAQLVEDGDDALANCRTIREEGERIATIVKDLLQFARDDSGRSQATPVVDVVQRTVRLVGQSFRRHGIDLVVEVAPRLPAVNARPQQLQQVLLNLLINARDALQQQPPGHDRGVQLRAATAGAEGPVVLTVSDNGPGIPPHLGDRIFEPFVTTKRARGGTGLGLSISRTIVEGYGGSIDVRSAPGEFTEFRVTLPRSNEPADPEVG